MAYNSAMKDIQIRYFLSVVDNGMSFTKASQTLYIAQPALTKHINDLGEELGVKLFDTTRKNAIKLTPAGELFYKLFTEFGDRLNTAIIQAKALNKQYSGEIKIACLNGWDMSLLIHKINTFQTEFPNISVSFYSDGFRAIQNGLRNNYYDVIIILEHEYEGRSNIIFKRLYSIPRVLLFSKNHVLAQKSDLSILDFKDDILYVVSSAETDLAKPINESYCKSKGFIPNIKEMPNLDSILLALGSGKGYAVQDKFQRAVNLPHLKYIELDDYLNIYAVWKKNNTNPSLPLLLDTLFDK
jgi:DNA-binding transcriptional LysR family regulator